MKVQLENIRSDQQSSFRLLHNPKLNDLFFWHFHPEYELVYIEGADGTRHVGEHISTFNQSDLVLIGSYIPHLNFDYGIKGNYRKEVVHITPSFDANVLDHINELSTVTKLLKQSQYGIAFKGEIKAEIGKRMKQLHTLDSFDRFLEVLRIMKLLSETSPEYYDLLHNHPVLNNKLKSRQLRLQKVYAFVSENYTRKISISEAAGVLNLGKEAFCRYFKKVTGTTFTAFLNQYRITQAKRLMLSGKNINETFYESGFESVSYFNRVFKKVTGENPSAYIKKIKAEATLLM
ncbi:MAG: AraC family transcriptional regulator [Bacteroidota bacterium]